MDKQERQQLITVEMLLDASDVLIAVQGAIGALRDVGGATDDDTRARAAASLQLGFANGLLLALVEHLKEGMSVNDALRAMCSGDLLLPPDHIE
jgi:hypothetical protein